MNRTLPERSARRAPLLIVLVGGLLALAGAAEVTADLPRHTVLRSLTQPGGWQRAMVADGADAVAERAERAALKSGKATALTDGATVLASLAGATGDAAVTLDLNRRALQLATIAVQEAPTGAQAHFIAGAAHSGIEPGSPETDRDLGRASLLNPHSASLQQRIGLVELFSNHPEKAAEHLRVAITGDVRLAEPLYKTLDKIDTDLRPADITPPTPRAYAALGSWLNRGADFESAEAAFRRGVQIAESSGDKGLTLFACHRLYGFLMSRRDFTAAEGLVATMLASGNYQGPQDQAGLLYHQGIALLRLKRAEDAALPLAQAARLQPSVIKYLNAYASSLATAGRHETAAQAWREALALPRGTESERRFEIPMRLALARSLATSGRNRESLLESKRVLMIEPDNKTARELAQELAYE